MTDLPLAKPTTRTIITTIDSLVEIFRDYFPAGDIPADAKAVKLYIIPAERGMFRIDAESDEWTGQEHPLRVNFDIKRVHAV